MIFLGYATLYMHVSSPLCIVELTTSAVRLQHAIYEALAYQAAYIIGNIALKYGREYHSTRCSQRVSFLSFAFRPPMFISSGSTCWVSHMLAC